jgi:hypothetical protein
MTYSGLDSDKFEKWLKADKKWAKAETYLVWISAGILAVCVAAMCIGIGIL